MSSIYQSISALNQAIPEYGYSDSLLASLSLFHLFVAFSFVSVPDAFYKKSLVKAHYKIGKFFHSIPMLVPLFNLALPILALQFLLKALNHPEDSAIAMRAVVALFTWVCSILLQKLSHSLVKMGVDHTMKREQELEQHNIKNWKTPPKWTATVVNASQWFLRPVVVGAENVSSENPGFYVMNHALLGMEMGPFIATIYQQTGVFLRGLGDSMHFGQLHGELLRYFGSVNGTRANVDALMENKDNILVYPGGGHEIMKPTSVPKYTLMWKQRLGFARMAIKHGYPIVPCASVGTEDMMDRLFDIDLGFLRKDQKVPVTVFRPDKLQRVYFWFGEPIPTAQYNGDWENTDFAKEVRDKAKAAVEKGIQELKERQANDPNRYLINHMINAMKEFCKNPFGVQEVPVITAAEEKMAPVPRMDTDGDSDSDDDSAWEPVTQAKKMD